jgi:hypothetical protein
VELEGHLLAACREVFARQKRLAEQALAQVSDPQLQDALGPEGNSLAVLIRHVSGNLRSRFTDFLTSDGEKPWRERDREFEVRAVSRDELMAAWERGWQALFHALDDLGPGDLVREVRIRGEAHSVTEALLRQLSHYGQHVGQIVMLAKHLAGPAWRTLSIPRGGSAAAKGEYKSRP